MLPGVARKKKVFHIIDIKLRDAKIEGQMGPIVKDGVMAPGHSPSPFLFSAKHLLSICPKLFQDTIVSKRIVRVIPPNMKLL